MSKAICVMGESGSGKTTSMRTLDPAATYYVDCDGKGLSWKGWRQQYNTEKKNYYCTDDQSKVLTLMSGISEKMPHIKTIVIDTANSIMVADEFRRMKEKGYDKWVDMAMSVFEITTLASKLRDDLNVIILFHVQVEKDEATGQRFVRILTNGKMLNKVGLEKYFTTVLLSKRNGNGEYVFETNANSSTAKSPLGAFDSDEVPNDMAAVLKALEGF